MIYRPMEPGTILEIELDWYKSFAILPHKTISGRWVWLRPIYKRIVWVYTGFVDEPESQYADIFEILKND